MHRCLQTVGVFGPNASLRREPTFYISRPSLLAAFAFLFASRRCLRSDSRCAQYCLQYFRGCFDSMAKGWRQSFRAHSLNLVLRSKSRVTVLVKALRIPSALKVKNGYSPVVVEPGSPDRMFPNHGISPRRAFRRVSRRSQTSKGVMHEGSTCPGRLSNQCHVPHLFRKLSKETLSCLISKNSARIAQASHARSVPLAGCPRNVSTLCARQSFSSSRESRFRQLRDSSLAFSSSGRMRLFRRGMNMPVFSRKHTTTPS